MRNTLKTGSIAFVLAVSSYGVYAAAHDDKSHEDHISKTYSYSDFDKISIGGVYEVDVRVGASHSISLTGDPKKMDRVKVSEDKGVLHLDTEKRKNKMKIKNTGEGIVAVITLPDLTAFKVSGVASADVTGVDAEDFDLSVAGVAEVNIEGRCDKLDVQVTGVGELDARDLKCKEADAALTGVGEMSVFASDSIDVSATGVGEVNVYGKPENISKNKAFFAKVNIK